MKASETNYNIPFEDQSDALDKSLFSKGCDLQVDDHQATTGECFLLH